MLVIKPIDYFLKSCIHEVMRLKLTDGDLHMGMEISCVS